MNPDREQFIGKGMKKEGGKDCTPKQPARKKATMLVKMAKTA